MTEASSSSSSSSSDQADQADTLPPLTDSTMVTVDDTDTAIQYFDPPTPRVMLAIDPTEASFLAALQAKPHDDDTRIVYADWLEERGQNIKAEYLRLQCELGSPFVEEHPEAPETLALHERLRAISPASDAWWRALTSRPLIEKCEVRFKFKCPKRWAALTPTSDPSIRHCDGCDRHVFFCASLVEVVSRGAKRECVAFDTSLMKNEANGAYDAAADDGVDGMMMGEIA